MSFSPSFLTKSCLLPVDLRSTDAFSPPDFNAWLFLFLVLSSRCRTEFCYWWRLNVWLGSRIWPIAKFRLRGLFSPRFWFGSLLQGHCYNLWASAALFQVLCSSCCAFKIKYILILTNIQIITLALYSHFSFYSLFFWPYNSSNKLGDQDWSISLQDFYSPPC